MITTNSKLRSLQYSIVHRFFCCKYNLHLWNIVECPDCLYCNQVDTLEHYFYYCEQSRGMWKQVEKIAYCALGLKINFAVLEVLLGIPCKKYTPHHIMNLLILFTKQFIYSQKREENIVLPTLLHRSLAKRCEIEIYLLNTNLDTHDFFLKEWKNVHTFISSLL